MINKTYVDFQFAVFVLSFLFGSFEIYHIIVFIFIFLVVGEVLWFLSIYTCFPMFVEFNGVHSTVLSLGNFFKQ